MVISSFYSCSSCYFPLSHLLSFLFFLCTFVPLAFGAPPNGCLFAYGTKTRVYFTHIIVPDYSLSIISCNNSPTSFSITPALPTGLLFNTTTTSVSGAPAVAAMEISYTVTPFNGDGAGTTLTVNMVVRDTANIICGGGSVNPLTGVNADKEGMLSLFVWLGGFQWSAASNWGTGNCCDQGLQTRYVRVRRNINIKTRRTDMTQFAIISVSAYPYIVFHLPPRSPHLDGI